MQTITIGRSTANAIVIANDSFVSGQHLTISRTADGRFLLQDLGSSNGTFVNGHRVMQAELRHNDIVKIGNTILPWPTYFEMPLAPTGGVFIKSVRFGRGSDNDVVLTDSRVSGNHAVIELTDQGYYQLRDLNSSNGTFVNNQRVNQVVLQPGDNLRLGPIPVDWLAHFRQAALPLNPNLMITVPPPSPSLVAPAPAAKPRRAGIWPRLLLAAGGAAVIAFIGFRLLGSSTAPSPAPLTPLPTDSLGAEILVNTRNLPPAPALPVQAMHHATANSVLKSCNLSGEHEELIRACDFTNPDCRNLAVELAGKSPGTFNLGQVCEIFDFCYANWKYVNDPQTTEFVSSASNTIHARFNGDCDDFAVLLNSMLLAVGGNTCLNYGYTETAGHAYTEVFVGDENVEAVREYLSQRYPTQAAGGNRVHFRKDNEGNLWLNLDWTAEYPGGEYFPAQTGRRFYLVENDCEDF